MKRFVALLLALGILVVAAPIRADKDDKKTEAKKEDKKDAKKEDKKEDKPKTDEKPTPSQTAELKKLSGTFTVTLFERDGKKSTPDELKKMKVVQNGAEWSFHMGDEITQGKDTVFPDKSPKEIDSVYTNGSSSGKTVLGIYEITADGVKYCWAEPSKERPKAFAAKADSGLTLMELKRVKEEQPESKKDKDGKDKEKDKGKEKEKDKGKEKDKPKDKEKDK
jgi:uncharacterized protein (TIGR03067 family)